ncbi:MAG: MBL fold metallo-hydrolase [Rhodothermaceae bacterium]|nr:MAG: MBL fold metallo-hydrolase [Rhodothermaceae bacterium]
MVITFWGVRGSVPTPGRHTCRYGGNTSCVSVEIEDRVLVLDAGTGLIELGASLAGTGRAVFVLLTHLHSDHIAGFPFCPLLYRTDSRLHLLSYEHEGRPWSLMRLLDGCHFPLRAADIVARPVCVEADPLGYLAAHGFSVRRLALNHPGGAFGYRITHHGRSVVFMPDNELDPPPPVVTAYPEMVAFCRGADVFIHDAQYLQEEHAEHRGWGHSTLEQACHLARDAGVGHFVAFHHDPSRTDDALDAMQERARALVAAHGIRCTVAYEGLRLVL